MIKKVEIMVGMPCCRLVAQNDDVCRSGNTELIDYMSTFTICSLNLAELGLRPVTAH